MKQSKFPCAIRRSVFGLLKWWEFIQNIWQPSIFCKAWTQIPFPCCVFLKTTHWLSACQGMKINTCSMFFLALLSLCAEDCPKHTMHCKQTLIIMEWHSFILLNSLHYREIFQYSLKSRSKWGFPELFQLSKNISTPALTNTHTNLYNCWPIEALTV